MGTYKGYLNTNPAYRAPLVTNSCREKSNSMASMGKRISMKKIVKMLVLDYFTLQDKYNIHTSSVKIIIYLHSLQNRPGSSSELVRIQ